MQKNVLFINFFPNYDRLPELGNNQNAQFDVFRKLSHAISTSLSLVGIIVQITETMIIPLMWGACSLLLNNTSMFSLTIMGPLQFSNDN
jgi:hypothetical protein